MAPAEAKTQAAVTALLRDSTHCVGFGGCRQRTLPVLLLLALQRLLLLQLLLLLQIRRKEQQQPAPAGAVVSAPECLMHCPEGPSAPHSQREEHRHKEHGLKEQEPQVGSCAGGLVAAAAACGAADADDI